MAVRFQCPWVHPCGTKCTKSYSKQSSVKTHYDVEHAGLRFTCDTCGDVFKDKRCLDGHNKSNHLGMKGWRKSKSKNLSCQQCAESPDATEKQKAKTYATKSGLERHILAEHREQEFACERCDMRFKDPGTLKYHQDHKHDGVKFECIDCEDCFASKQRLLIHIDRSAFCRLREPKKRAAAPVERKRKLGELDKTAALLFLESIPDKIKNSSPRECLHPGCTIKRLGYGFLGGDKIYCGAHKGDEDGVQNLGNINLCVYKGCITSGHNAVQGAKGYRFCAPHRDELIEAGLPEEAVISEKHVKCKIPDCTVSASYDSGKHCRAHSTTGISDDKRACSMVCCKDGGPRPQYVHPDDGSTICAFGARVLMEDALLHNDTELSRSLMHHFGRSNLFVLNEQSAFRASIEQHYWKMLDACTRVCFDEPVTGKPKTTGDLRPDMFYLWEIDGEKMAIHIEYDEDKRQHEDDSKRLKWIAEASATLGRVYVIRIDGKTGTGGALCTMKRRGTVGYYSVNEVGQRVASQVAHAVKNRIEWIKSGLAPDDAAGREYKLTL